MFEPFDAIRPTMGVFVCSIAAQDTFGCVYRFAGIFYAARLAWPKYNRRQPERAALRSYRFWFWDCMSLPCCNVTKTVVG